MVMIQSIDLDSKSVKPLVQVTIYCRVSSLIQIDGYGLQRQQDAIRAYLEDFDVPKELGYEIDRDNYVLLEDAGKSAYHGYHFSKGQLGQFRQKVLDGEITIGLFIIENVDRFCRMEEYLAIQEFTNLINNGIDILEVDTGEIFSRKVRKSLNKLTVSIERAYAESDRKSKISERSWKNRKRKSLEEGIAINNNTPDWLSLSEDKQSYIVNKERVKILNEIFRMYAEGFGGTAIVNKLNKEKRYYNKTSWSTNKFYHLLRNRRLIGFLGDERHYPEVIDSVLFEQVQSLLNGNVRKGKKAGTMMRSIFNGIAKCGFCGNGMICQTMTSSASYLRCIAERSKTTKCTHAKLIRYKEAEQIILEHLCNLNWDELKKGNSTHRDDIDVLKTQLSIITDKLQKLDLLIKETEDDDDKISLINIKNKNRKELTIIDEKISALTTKVEVPDLEVLTSLNEIQDLANVELRQKVYSLLSKTVSSIECTRTDTPDPFYTFTINYIGASEKHLLIVELKNNCKVTRFVEKISDDTVTYYTPSFVVAYSNNWESGLPEIRGLQDCNGITIKADLIDCMHLFSILDRTNRGEAKVIRDWLVIPKVQEFFFHTSAYEDE